MLLRRMALFKRLPKLRPDPTYPIVSDKVKATFPAFADDFAILEHELVPYFTAFDQASLQSQNRFRWEQVLLIVLSTLAAVLGAFQAATNLPVFGVIEMVVAAALAGLAFLAQQLSAQKEYYTSRLKAELLRSEYFLFLGRSGVYADPQNRVQQLRRRIAQIRTDGGRHEQP